MNMINRGRKKEAEVEAEADELWLGH